MLHLMAILFSWYRILQNGMFATVGQSACWEMLSTWRKVNLSSWIVMTFQMFQIAPKPKMTFKGLKWVLVNLSRSAGYSTLNLSWLE
ncbi:hypothetical protein NPIL_368681 [Nephila pilipes]|uniref:Uncharacterized protein n=1 Tax=Nephila pilipes TaxID=299642 RepID=A0A8X6PWJ0_NEPPI|nr:hypothetical protein NPIL_368681 [Nephila pilipes]